MFALSLSSIFPQKMLRGIPGTFLGSRSISIHPQYVNVHAFMQDTHDFQRCAGVAVENHVFANGVGAEVPGYIFARCSKAWCLLQGLEYILDPVQIFSFLCHDPLSPGIVCDPGKVDSGRAGYSQFFKAGQRTCSVLYRNRFR